jgi:hypothetical protein
MEFVVAVFGFGSLLLLLGIVGGDLKYRGVSVPRLGRLPRFTVTAIGSGLLVVSGLLWIRASPSAPQPGADTNPASTGEGEGTVTVIRELASFHVTEQLDLTVGQRRAGRIDLDGQRPQATLDVELRGGGPHQYDALLVATTPGGDRLEFGGSGVLEATRSRRFLVTLNRSSASVEIVPE